VPYPHFEGKHAHDALVEPADFVRYWVDSGILPADFAVPAGVVLLYQPRLFAHVLRSASVTPLTAQADRPTAFMGLHTFDDTGGRVGVIGGFGIGAPAATVVLEALASLGVTRIVGIGTAGSLVRGLDVADVVVCTRAVRDEGVSHHYLPFDRWAEPAAGLTGRLSAALADAGLDPSPGAAWTIDAPYRETVAEAKHYADEGVSVVEMEAAALFSVGRVRGVDVASAFAVSDLLAEGEWVPHFRHPRLAERLEQMVPPAVAALAEG
jgi:uridine phosphorylase